MEHGGLGAVLNICAANCSGVLVSAFVIAGCSSNSGIYIGIGMIDLFIYVLIIYKGNI
ncbi:MAG: hypothetical protein Hyperionvirus44_2 [Hyperionvirus sp.]|uniref:Transmembrane protein n=1 Tax=Hyperionvirus sp. TaxID=2487770 RepID=A0A3G5AE12_9VIRU|nr:MAG: hypothetical protein Hyperionvirus44_2 [Hyperionvirus sp.]